MVFRSLEGRLLAPFDTLYEITILLGAALAILIALTLGGPAQRRCGWIVLADALVLTPLLAIMGPLVAPWGAALKSSLVLVAYGQATLSWSDRWLIPVTGLQSFCLILELSALLEPGLLVSATSFLVIAARWLQAIVLATAAVGAAIQRHDQKRAGDPAR